MITKTGSDLHELGYADSIRAKVHGAKGVTPGYIAGHSAAAGLHGSVFGAVGSVLPALMDRRLGNIKARLAVGAKRALVGIPSAALTASAWGLADAPLEYSYTKGLVPSKNPFKSMLGYVQAPSSTVQAIQKDKRG